MLAFDDLNDAAFGASVSAAAFDAGENAVAVHGVGQVVTSDEEIAFHARDRRIGDKESVSVAMGNNSAGNKIGVVATVRCRSRRRRWLLVFWPTLCGNFPGSRLAVFTLCGGFLCFFCAGQFVTAARFFYVATFFQPMQDAWEEAAAMMF